MIEIESLIKNEIDELEKTKSPSKAINLLNNLIVLKNKSGSKYIDNYRDIKKFINNYVEVIKIGDFGYDELNYKKIEKLLGYLNPKEQVSLLKYSISVLSRELPEYNKDWFFEKIHLAEINSIFLDKNYSSYPKAYLLICGLNTKRLVFALIVFFILVNIILLPAPEFIAPIFIIQYENYSTNLLLNHTLNILSLFVDLENKFEIKPVNWFGLLLVIFGKISFIIIVVNFLYRKISDKISAI